MIASAILDVLQRSPSSFTDTTRRFACLLNRSISPCCSVDEQRLSRSRVRGELSFMRGIFAVGVDVLTAAAAAPSALRRRFRDGVSDDAASPRRPRDAALDDPSPRGDVRVASDRVMCRSLARSLARRVTVCRFASRADAPRPDRTHRGRIGRIAPHPAATRPLATRRVRWRRVAAGCDAMRTNAIARAGAAASPRRHSARVRNRIARDEPRVNVRVGDVALR